MLHTTTGYGYQLGSSNKTILVLRIKKESRDSTPLCTHYIFCRDVFRENWPPWKVATLSKTSPYRQKQEGTGKHIPLCRSILQFTLCPKWLERPVFVGRNHDLLSITLEPPGTEHRKSFWPAQQISCVLLTLFTSVWNLCSFFASEAPRGGPFWVLLWALGLRCYKKCAPKRSRRGSDGGDALASAVKSKMKFHQVKETWKILTNTGECITKDHLGLVWGQYG